MKIIFINTKYSIGGAANIANILYKKVKENGYDAYYFYGRGHGFDDDFKAISDSNAIRISNKKTILKNYIYSRFFGHDFFTFKKGLEIFKKHLEDSDIIHIHNLHGYVWNPLKILKLMPEDKKIIWTIHDLWLITGRCAFPFECEGYKKACGACKIKKNYYPKTYFDFSKRYLMEKMKILKNISKNILFVTPSEWAKRQLLNSYMFKSLSLFNIKVINNGIERNIFYKRDYNKIYNDFPILKGKKVVLFVGEDLNDPRKGIKYILETINYFKDNNNIMFVGIGKKVKNFKSSNLIQIGYLDNKEKLAQFYSLADVFVTTTLDDNYPTTILESLSCETPVVAFDVGGISEILKSGVNGFLVKRGNLKELIEKIKIALTEKDVFNFNNNVKSVDKFADEYIKLYVDY